MLFFFFFFFFFFPLIREEMSDYPTGSFINRFVQLFVWFLNESCLLIPKQFLS